MAYKILPIPAFNDNYIWLIETSKEAVCIDPGDASVVLNYLEKKQLNLTHILITHHHYDHTGGVSALKKKFPHCLLIGPSDPRIKALDKTVTEGDTISLANMLLTFTVITTPGHTLSHICFYEKKGLLFCGDTLFSAGCGRLFEGTAEQMHQSLSKLSALPDETNIYPAHEYTYANLQFALQVESDNQVVQNLLKQQVPGQLSLPSTIGKEKFINPFLRTNSKSIKHYAATHNVSIFDSVSIFRFLRQQKDLF